MDNRERRPKAPKKFRGLVDMKKIPKDPPFKAYVGNISYDATEEDIQDFFGESVVSVRLKEVDGKPRGYGFVEFETRHALIDALAKDDEMLMNRNIRVDLAGEQQGENTDPSYTAPMNTRDRRPRAPPMNYRGPVDNKRIPNDSPFTAYIGNLSYDATEEDIQDFFGVPIVSVRLLESGGRPRGYGFVEFETRQALIDALARNDEMFMNRKIRIDLAGEQQQREVSDTESSYTAPMNNRARQQTSFKNFRGQEGLKKIPNDPPFTAYIGNLSNDVTEEDIQDFFGESVVSVRLIEADGRPRGYGFVEFETRQALIDALAKTDEMFLNRKLRIDVAGESQQEGPKRGMPYAGARPKTGPLKAVRSDQGWEHVLTEQLRQMQTALSAAGLVASSARGVSPSRGAGQRSRSRSRTEKSQDTLKDISQKYICIHYLVGKCSYGVRCLSYHCKIPYQWMYKPTGSEYWIEVQPAENMLIEKNYCNPSEDDYRLLAYGRFVKLDFSTMTTIGDHVFEFHRLSTNTSVVMDTQPLATKWIWYWKNQVGSWSKYGDDDHGYKSSLHSNEIEQAFINNPEGQLEFTTAGHDYVLNFQEMLQCNLHYKTKRAIRRRPELVDEAEFEIRKKQGKNLGELLVRQELLSTSPDPPAVWRLRASDDLINHYQIVQLDKKNPSMRQEYQEIEDFFCKHLPRTVTIKSIERVENGDLWHSYASKKIKMRKKNNNQDVKEERLFHGTKNEIVEAICRQGFDFRLSGKESGARYGKGSYFANSSAYSNCYTESDQNNKIMFVAKVLIGEYAKGDQSYTRPPPKDPSNRNSQLFDSCVDHVKAPTMFVIFQLDQVYPEYLIKYEYTNETYF